MKAVASLNSGSSSIKFALFAIEAEQRLHLGALARHVVIVGERVDPDHLVPLGQEALDQGASDESGGAGDDHVHRSIVTGDRRMSISG